MADAITSTCPEATTTPTTGLSTPTGTRAGRQIPPLYTNPSQEPETVFLNTPPLSPALYKRSEDIFPPLPDDDVGKETRRRRFGRMLRQIRDRSEERTTRLKMGDTTGLAPMGRLWDEFVSESEWKSKDLDVYRRLKTAAEVDALIYSRELESGEEGDLIVIDHDWDLIRIPRTELADLCMPTSAVPKDVHCGVRSRGRSGSSPARISQDATGGVWGIPWHVNEKGSTVVGSFTLAYLVLCLIVVFFVSLALGVFANEPGPVRRAASCADVTDRWYKLIVGCGVTTLKGALEWLINEL